MWFCAYGFEICFGFQAMLANPRLQIFQVYEIVSHSKTVSILILYPKKILMHIFCNSISAIPTAIGKINGRAWLVLGDLAGWRGLLLD